MFTGLPPHVSARMLSPGFWLTDDAYQLDHRDALRSFQQQINETDPAMRDFIALCTQLRTSETDVFANWPHLHPPLPTRRRLYDGSGRPLSDAFWHRMEASVRSVSFDDPPRPGLILRRCSVRRWPTMTPGFRTPLDREFDQFQETALHTFEPVLILTQTRNRQWSYILSMTYRGWIKQLDIAQCTWEEHDRWGSPTEFLTCTSRQLCTHPSPYDSSVSTSPIEFAAYIPFADDQGHAIDGQSSLGNVVIHLPGRTAKGTLNIKTAMISGENSGCKGNLPYSRGSIVTSAFALLTQRYGWGDNFDCHDCSSFVRDVFRTVGLQIPRDTSQQEAVLPKRVEFTDNLSTDERHTGLRSLGPGDLLYMPGHTMIYLGFHEQHYYVIHDLSEYTEITGREKRRVAINEVMVTSLDIRDGSGRTFFQALTSGISLFPN